MSARKAAAASKRNWCPFCGESRPTIPTTKSPAGSSSDARAASRDGRSANLVRSIPLRTTTSLPGGIRSCEATKSRTASDTAITCSVRCEMAALTFRQNSRVRKASALCRVEIQRRRGLSLFSQNP